MVQLSFSADEWISQYREGNPIWIATLCNGQTVYCDDGRYEPHSAWSRLKEYCRENCLTISEMRFGFRSNMFSLPPNKAGYFFCRSLLCGVGQGVPTYSWKLGYIENGIVKVQSWIVPPFIAEGTEQREINDCGDFLIS